MYEPNDAIAAGMKKGGIEKAKGLYSPSLMKTRIKAIDDKLMLLKYFGE